MPTKYGHHFNKDNGLASMPDKYVGLFYNACTDPCDMLEGPCACGAWHHQAEWPDNIQMEVFGNISSEESIIKRVPGRKS